MATLKRFVTMLLVASLAFPPDAVSLAFPLLSNRSTTWLHRHIPARRLVEREALATISHAFEVTYRRFQTPLSSFGRLLKDFNTHSAAARRHDLPTNLESSSAFIEKLKPIGIAISVSAVGLFIYSQHYDWVSILPRLSLMGALIGIPALSIWSARSDPPERDIEAAAGYLEKMKVNFDPRFYQRVRELSQIPAAQWTHKQWDQYQELRQAATRAADYLQGWLSASKYADAFNGHPIVMLSLEGKISVSEMGDEPRLTSFHGGLGVLFGEWINAIAYLGGVSPLNLPVQAPTFLIFIPDYHRGVTTMRVDAFGYPKQGARDIQRPQDYGINYFLNPKTGEPLEAEIHLNDTLTVFVRYRAIPIGGIHVIMPTTDFDKNDQPETRAIFDELYRGPLSSRFRFEQEWVSGLSAYEFQRMMGYPIEAPVHLNETATFAYTIALIRAYMEQGATLQQALKRTGGQLIFFTHTLVGAGIDRFIDYQVPLGHYIHAYFKQSDSPQIQEESGEIARLLIHGPEFEPHIRFEDIRQNLAPLQFIIRLAMQYGGTVAAVSQLNAIKAGDFFVQENIVTPGELVNHPVVGITNGVDHLFWMNKKLLNTMSWDAADLNDRHPEAILDPTDPLANKLAEQLERHQEFQSYQASRKSSKLSDKKLFELLARDKQTAIEMIRQFVQQQYIRETSAIEQRAARAEASQEELERLHALRVRWARWCGIPSPEEWVRRWDSLPLEEQAPFINQLHRSRLTGLLSPVSYLAVWARRIVPYKRMLFTLLGEHLPYLEHQIDTRNEGGALTPHQIDELISELRHGAYYTSGDNPYGAFTRFVRAIRDHQIQFVFAGKTFSQDGKSSVAFLHRAIERLAEEVPEIQDRVIFLEGYDETRSKPLVRGADIWLNTPKRPLEASGTSGMKVAKGNLFASPDGWAASSGSGDTRVFKQKVFGVNPDHPDTWHESGGAKDERSSEEIERQPDPSKYYYEQEALNYFGLLYTDADNYQRARRNQDALKDWLRGIRRWTYFKSLVYDIRREFTGGLVPSDDPSIPGGQEIGIFDLYHKALENLSSSRTDTRILKPFGEGMGAADQQEDRLPAALRIALEETDFDEIRRLLKELSTRSDAERISVLKALEHQRPNGSRELHAWTRSLNIQDKQLRDISSDEMSIVASAALRLVELLYAYGIRTIWVSGADREILKLLLKACWVRLAPDRSFPALVEFDKSENELLYKSPLASEALRTRMIRRKRILSAQDPTAFVELYNNTGRKFMSVRKSLRLALGDGASNFIFGFLADNLALLSENGINPDSASTTYLSGDSREGLVRVLDEMQAAVQDGRLTAFELVAALFPYISAHVRRSYSPAYRSGLATAA